MSKYNSVIYNYLAGMKSCELVVERGKKKIIELKKEVQRKIDEQFSIFTENLESEIEDWKPSDYDDFIKRAESDERLEGRAILTISAAYAKTHKGDEERIHNDTCRIAMIREAFEWYTGKEE